MIRGTFQSRKERMYRINGFLFIRKPLQINTARFRLPLKFPSILPRKFLTPRHGDGPDGSARREGFRHEGLPLSPSSNVNGKRGFGLVTLELDGCSDPELLRLQPRDNVRSHRSLNKLIYNYYSRRRLIIRSTWNPYPSL